MPYINKNGGVSYYGHEIPVLNSAEIGTVRRKVKEIRQLIEKAEKEIAARQAKGEDVREEKRKLKKIKMGVGLYNIALIKAETKERSIHINNEIPVIEECD